MHLITACRHTKNKRAKKIHPHNLSVQVPFQVTSRWKKQQSGYKYVTSILLMDFCLSHPSSSYTLFSNVINMPKCLLQLIFLQIHSSNELDRKSQPPISKIVPVDKQESMQLRNLPAHSTHSGH